MHIRDVQSGLTTKDLTQPQKDNSVVFAVSPDGQRIAYHRVADWGKRNNSIVIIDRNGALLKTLPIAEGLEVKSIAWGASPLRSKDAK